MSEREIVCNLVRTAIGTYGGRRGFRMGMPRSTTECCAMV